LLRCARYGFEPKENFSLLSEENKIEFVESLELPQGDLDIFMSIFGCTPNKETWRRR
jgi:hypothetical protein